MSPEDIQRLTPAINDYRRTIEGERRQRAALGGAATPLELDGPSGQDAPPDGAAKKKPASKKERSPGKKPGSSKGA